MPQIMKGWNVKVYVNDVEVGRASSLTLEVATGLDPFYELGSRKPAELVEGNEEITGTLTRAVIDTSLLAYASTSGQTSEKLPYFNIKFVSQITGNPTVWCYCCKAETWSPDLPQDDFITEDLDFRALYLSYGTAS